MFYKGERVRHIDEHTDKQYGVMEVLEIKGDYAICRHGDFYNLGVVTFQLTELRRENK